LIISVLLGNVCIFSRIKGEKDSRHVTDPPLHRCDMSLGQRQVSILQ
jgi:hypothetical protein